MNLTSDQLLLKPDASQYWGGSNALFVHNWRTGGTSLHSLLKVNLLSRYIKIGDQFNRFGKGKRTPSQAVNTLNDVRQRLRKGSVLAGHLFCGIEAFLPRQWDLWVSAREPLARIRSGLLRFHSRELRNFNKNALNIIPHSVALNSPSEVHHLLETSLKYENNGFCRRLAALTLAESFAIGINTNIEKPDFLSASYTDDGLYRAAKANLARVKVLFLAEQLNASILCLEKTYNLPPLLHPFSGLHLNSAKLVGYDQSHVNVLNESTSILERSQQVDLKLWPRVQAMFDQQLSRLGIDEKQVRAKEAIHAKQLFLPEWFDGSSDAKAILELMTKALAMRVESHPDIADEIVAMVSGWPCLHPEARLRLRQICH